MSYVWELLHVQLKLPSVTAKVISLLGKQKDTYFSKLSILCEMITFKAIYSTLIH